MFTHFVDSLLNHHLAFSLHYLRIQVGADIIGYD